MSKLTWPAAERNKQAILKELQRLLAPRGTLLELASGTGQHACYFAEHLEPWTIQPSDVEAANLASIDPRFGVRDLEAVLDVAKEHGFRLRERVEMPANNQLIALTSIT